MTYGDTLRQALSHLCGDRDEVRGDPALVYHRAADIATAIAGKGFSPADVIVVLLAAKLAREKVGRHDPDNYVDAAAYVDILAYLNEPGAGMKIKCDGSES